MPCTLTPFEQLRNWAMSIAMKLETLNIWGGRIYQPLIEHVQKQAKDIDIFCFQEVFSTQSKRNFISEHAEPKYFDYPINDYPACANIFQKLLQALPAFYGYYSSSQDRLDNHNFKDEDLSLGLTMFIKKTIQVKAKGNLFVHRSKNSIVGTDISTIGRNLQYIQFERDKKQFTVANLHGLWNGKDKTDSFERIEQSRKTKAFLDSTSGAKILCGDFNLLPDLHSLVLLEQGYVNFLSRETASDLHEVGSTRNQTALQIIFWFLLK